MKVFIAVDMEGITGLVSWAQCGRPNAEHYDFAFARRMIHHDVNAAIRGACAGGATHIVVKDSHGNSKNILIDELLVPTHPESNERTGAKLELITGQGFYGPDGMVTGLDSSFDSLVLIGWHAKAGTHLGVMEHTYTGGVHRTFVNDLEVGEIALASYTAGMYGVPVVAVSSDVTGCGEAAALNPGIETAAVKRALGRYSAQALSPAESGLLIEAKVKKGVAGCKSRDPIALPAAPITIKMEFNRSEEADYCENHPAAKRVDGYTLEGTLPNWKEAHATLLNWFLAGNSGLGSQN